MHSNDRVFVLSIMEGEKSAINTGGLLDKRIFKGSNNLRAIRDSTGMWRLEYDDGAVPPALRQKFTSFNKLVRFVKPYFWRRNVKINQIND